MIPGATATALGGLAVLHLVWANGSSFPFSSRAELAEAVIGSESVPGPAACAAVAAGLSSAALLVGGRRLVPPRLRRVGVGVVTATLATRGVLGLVGRTDVVSPAEHLGPLPPARPAPVRSPVPGAGRRGGLDVA